MSNMDTAMRYDSLYLQGQGSRQLLKTVMPLPAAAESLAVLP